MAESPTTKPSFSRVRRWGIFLNVFISAICLLALVVMANYLASGYYKRFQLSDNARSELSPQTVRVLNEITNDVEVTMFFDTNEEEDLSSWVSGLLKQYRHVSSRIKLKSVDPIRAPGEAAAVLAKYQLDHLTEKNFVIFESAGNTHVVHGNRLLDTELEQIAEGKLEFRKRVVAFKGEMLFTSALFNVTHPRALKAYFLFGHGEHDPDKATSDDGYARFASILKDENNVDWLKLSLRGTNEVPADCQLLIIASPSKARFSDHELSAIQTYLSKGGRLLVLMNNLLSAVNSGVEDILLAWGVKVGDDMVMDPDYAVGGNDIIPAEINPSHPVTKTMHAEGLQIYMILPRSLDRVAGGTQVADPPKVEALFRTSTNAVSRAPVRIGEATEYQDRPGTFALAVAVEQGNIRGVTAERGATRIIVVGDSLCFGNRTIKSAANHQFASFAVNWLLSQPAVLLEGLGPKPVKEYSLRMTPRQRKAVSMILLAGLPGAFLVFGGLVWLRRRS